jgi:hypothetical protein
VGEQYFVRSSQDAPENGPFSRAQLAKSLENSLLGVKATARRQGSDEWLPLKDVVASFPPKKKKRSARGSGDANDEHALASAARIRGVNPLVWIGVVVGLVGVGLTVTFAATNLSSDWPLAFVAVGVYLAIRGFIRGPASTDDE